ncbi:MAG TPA: hypothetical protein VKF62_11675, partial [Planctomycetota bacterium]|nr:hypothetical protein [Planctomycetota bacterium]
MPREDLRQLIHAAMCAWALLFPWIGKAGAIALGAVAVLFNAFVFPRLSIGRTVSREGDRRWTGIQWYPTAVLGLVLALPLPIAAGAWGVLGAGDAASNVVGRRLGRRNPLPWNPAKSWAGVAGFFFAAFPVAHLLMSANLAWGDPRSLGNGEVPALLVAALAGAAGGAIVESLPLRLDD